MNQSRHPSTLERHPENERISGSSVAAGGRVNQDQAEFQPGTHLVDDTRGQLYDILIADEIHHLSRDAFAGRQDTRNEPLDQHTAQGNTSL